MLGVAFFMLPFSTKSGVPLGGGGGGAALLHCLRFVLLFFVEGVPRVAVSAQCSPGPANSLLGDVPGAESYVRRGSRYACLRMCCAAWAPRLAVGPSPSLLAWGVS